MKRAGVKMLRDKEWREVSSIMYKKEKVYVPKDNQLRMEIIRLYHDMLVGGHGGQWKTVELVTRNFWWLGITKEVKQYVKEYDACQRNKNCTEQLVGKLMPNSIPEKPWILLWLSKTAKSLYFFSFSFLLLLRWSMGRHHMTSHKVTKCVTAVTEGSHHCHIHNM